MTTSAIAAQAVIANAIKASGVVVRLEPADWLAILERAEAPLVVVRQGGVFRKHVQYLTSYRGLAFFTRSDVPLMLPRRAEVVVARKISIPEM